ncbi:MAG: PKD domain-containing protein [Chitinophagaceae bacterium]|nr:PKD domain-containing protein [Chitinophagaceae bacterium]MBL0057164.1 PKD domain-containing protein [Chitinophagaceae bacterium]
MSNNSIYTRNWGGLDRNVWFVFIAAILLPLGLVAYRLFDKPKCSPVNFTFKSISVDTGNVFPAGETIIFQAYTTSSDINWDFGDKQGGSTGQFVEHKYMQPGDYFVNASTGFSCDNRKKITITKAPEDPVKTLGTGDEIKGPTFSITEKENIFTSTLKATAYEWTLVNYSYPAQTGPTAKFTFTEPRAYTIQLMVDNDRTRKYFSQITVKPKPSPVATQSGGGPKPTISSTLVVSPETFKTFMQQVVDEKKFAADFGAYLCSGGATPVIINGEKEGKNFEQACAELKGKKVRKKILVLDKRKIEITDVKITRDASDCVTQLEITYK